MPSCAATQSPTACESPVSIATRTPRRFSSATASADSGRTVSATRDQPEHPVAVDHVDDRRALSAELAAPSSPAPGRAAMPALGHDPLAGDDDLAAVDRRGRARARTSASNSVDARNLDTALRRRAPRSRARSGAPTSASTAAASASTSSSEVSPDALDRDDALLALGERAGLVEQHHIHPSGVLERVRGRAPGCRGARRSRSTAARPAGSRARARAGRR